LSFLWKGNLRTHDVPLFDDVARLAIAPMTRLLVLPSNLKDINKPKSHRIQTTYIVMGFRQRAAVLAEVAAAVVGEVSHLSEEEVDITVAVVCHYNPIFPSFSKPCHNIGHRQGQHNSLLESRSC
jgi:hypothetical protein